MFDEYRNAEFKNLTRSTIPLLVYWRDRERVLRTLSHELRIPDLDTRADVTFEHATTVKKPGRGKASMTDVMVRSPSTVVATEAKWTEPRYANVARWMGESRNKAHVRDYWLALIKRVARFRDDASVEKVVYQLLHRTASACATSPSRAIVLYQLFDDGRRKVDYASDLCALASLLEPTERLEFWIQKIPLAATNEYRDLQERVAETPQQLVPTIVKRAIAETTLFEFGSPTFEQIGD